MQRARSHSLAATPPSPSAKTVSPSASHRRTRSGLSLKNISPSWRPNRRPTLPLARHAGYCRNSHPRWARALSRKSRRTNYWRCCAFLKRPDSARRRGDFDHLPAVFFVMLSPRRGLQPILPSRWLVRWCAGVASRQASRRDHRRSGVRRVVAIYRSLWGAARHQASVSLQRACVPATGRNQAS